MAISFAREGCKRIGLLDRDEDGLTETARLCKEASPAALARTYSIPVDVRVETDVAAALDCVVEEWGRIDYAVNSAGVTLFPTYICLAPVLCHFLFLDDSVRVLLGGWL